MSKSNVIKLYPKNAALNPDCVLEQAIGSYNEIVLVGYNKSGNLEARASTNIKRKDMLWMIEQLKILILGLED